jgi:hypothetical protein
MYNKGVIHNKIFSVMSEDEYIENRSKFSIDDDVAIQKDGLLYPMRTQTDPRPGFRIDGDALLIYNDPSENDAHNYSDKDVIDFDNISTMKDIIDRQNELSRQERSILTSPDHIYTPIIKDTDAPEMRLMKEAICNKNIDLDKYEGRFGPNFTNDKRILQRPNITLSKIKTMCKALDIEAELVFRDKGPDVPNPIGKEIKIILTDGEGAEDNDTE